MAKWHGQPVEWRRSEAARVKAGDAIKKTPEGGARYGGRPLIERDTPINGGVYIGEGDREAIVVDEKKGPEYDRWFGDVMAQTRERLRQHPEQTVEHHLLEQVFSYVVDRMQGTSAEVDALLKKFHVEAGEKVDLRVFMAAHVGVCRHRALAAAYLLERAIQGSALRGTVSVDRNRIPGIGAHAWVRYTSPRGRVWILDPTLMYMGRLREDDTPYRWAYERPSDTVSESPAIDTQKNAPKK